MHSSIHKTHTNTISPVTLVVNGRFHHFHLARQMERFGLLKNIYTGFPKNKLLKEEEGVAYDKIVSFPWLQAPYMLASRNRHFYKMPWLRDNWRIAASVMLDKFVSKKINSKTTLIAISSTGLHCGKVAQQNGGLYICDRGSSHISYQNEILKEEYKIWKVPYVEIDKRLIAKERAEYEQADYITVPSQFVLNSFLEKGVAISKLKKATYGSRIDKFKKTNDPPSDIFRVLWVGSIQLRKGLFYLLDAFARFSHPQKELLVVGTLSVDVKSVLHKFPLQNVIFMGSVPNNELPGIYSSAHVFVIPSLEEGLAMVQGEAMACGCPVIGTFNSGALDLVDDGLNGFVVPIRSADAILQRLEELAQNPFLRQKMSEAAIQKTKSMGGWDSYGQRYFDILTEISQ